jgi:hypothetical protein
LNVTHTPEQQPPSNAREQQTSPKRRRHSSYRTTRYRSQDELLSDVNFKLIRAIDKFDPARRLRSNGFTQFSSVAVTVYDLSRAK